MSKEYFKNYYDKNKTNLQNYNKRYYIKNKSKGDIMIKCKICGEEIKKASLYGHIKSKYNNSYLNSLEMSNRKITDCY